jgi:hypothetical protein
MALFKIYIQQFITEHIIVLIIGNINVKKVLNYPMVQTGLLSDHLEYTYSEMWWHVTVNDHCKQFFD